MSDQSRQKATIFVGGLDNKVTIQTLQDAFIPFGDLVDVSLPKPDLPSSKDPHRGFGYVEFSDPADAIEAIRNMDQAELYGRVIKVNHAKPLKDSRDGLGSKTAVWEQEGYAAKYNVGDDDHLLAENGTGIDKTEDPMQGLEGLDVAGPKTQ